MYEVGVRSVPVISVTGALTHRGMVDGGLERMFAIQTRSASDNHLGTVIILSVVKQIWPGADGGHARGPGWRRADGPSWER